MASLGCTMSLTFVFVLQALTFTGAVKLKQSAIISHLRDTSDPDVIPLPENNKRPLEVKIDLYLVKILDVDRERNEIDVLVVQDVIYNNPALAWDVTKEGFNSSKVTIPSHYLWQPDITVYNAVGSQEVVYLPKKEVVFSDGTVFIIPSCRVRVWCDLHDVDSHNGANCPLKLRSWTQSSETLSLSSGNGISMEEYMATPNYEVLATSATTESVVYSGCPESYEHIEFTFIVRKQDYAIRASEEENGSEK